jgi:hypothetical protein
MNPHIPIACTLSSDELQRRRHELLPGLAGRVIASERVEGGLRWQFAAETDIVSAIAKVVDAERHCCRFLRFEIAVDPDGGPVSLTITAPPEAKEVLEQLLSS